MIGGRRRAPKGGRMGGTALGPGGYCVCPKCRHKEAHIVGVPCYKKGCPQCGIKMVRE